MNYFLLDGRSATDHFPGIGRYVSNLAQALVPLLAQEEHLLILRDAKRPSSWQLPPHSTKVTLIDTALSPFSLNQQWQISQLLQAYDIACYHSPYYIMPYRMKIPTILTLYDLIPQKYPAYVSLKARLLSNLFTKIALRSADHFITISAATRQDFLEHYNLTPNTVTAVSLAADPKFTPQPASAIQKTTTQYNIPAPYILYLGINKPHKNLLRLLQAWQIVQNEIDSKHTLVIAGAWDERYPQAKTWAVQNKLDNIHFAGPIADQDLPALYSGADLFLFPSIYEGFGLPVLEAMACGTAVSCSNSSSLPEVGGNAAHYFDPTAIAEMSQQIITLLQNPALRKIYAQKGLTQAQTFSWQQTAVSTLNIYRTIR